MNRYLFGCAIAAVMALAVSVAAQSTPSSQQPTGTATAQTQADKVTVEGCLVREQDVPGRKPNVAEKAGVMEDYILTNAKVVKGTAPSSAGAQAKPGETTGTTGTLSPMYDVKGISGDKLKELVGKRVQIEGKFEDTERSPSAKPGEDLANINGTTIRQTSGECPPK
jgi:hypothetical protein